MEQNPYEAPQADRKQKSSPDGKNRTDNPAGVVLALGCLMFPASFAAFFSVCTATGAVKIGIQPKPWDFGPPIGAAALVACIFICAMVVTWKRSQRQAMNP